MSPERLVEVAVDAPLHTPLTYTTELNCAIGSSVIVPLGKRSVHGVVLGESQQREHNFEVKKITSLNDQRPILNPHFIKWLEWISEYYVHPIGMVTELAFPPLEKKISNRKSKKADVVRNYDLRAAPLLTKSQSESIQAILSRKGFHTHLLFGVTGSGKTEVYLQLLADTISKGQRGLVLVPEISLTPQLIQRFAERFGDQIAVLHSHLTDRERTNQWWSMCEGDKKILIGARSALFCPMSDLGMIIVDEEHEPSYKQDEKLKYHARDCAVMLAKQLNVPIVLGSATPSLETWQNAQSGKYSLHTMDSRVGERELPSVEIVDLREHKEQNKNSERGARPYWLTPKLHQEIVDTLDRKEQVALFLNRRGVAPTVLCADCGYIYKCPNCEISLTLHNKRNLVCHYCDYNSVMSDTCISCKIGEPQALGIGSEKIESDMRELFPQANVARADRDEIHSRETLEDLISKMEKHEIDILVGTQMIAKGLDFPKLTLVGLVLADVGFNIPDFRATERSFQLLTQVSGRAGRHVTHGGKVIIQTYNPEHLSVIYAQGARYVEFAAKEIESRRELNYPPFGKLAALRIVSSTPRAGDQTAVALVERAELLKTTNKHYSDIQILGPAEAPIFKLRNKFRYHVLFKTLSPNVLSSFCRQLLNELSWVSPGTKVQVDIDPLNLL